MIVNPLSGTPVTVLPLCIGLVGTCPCLMDAMPMGSPMDATPIMFNVLVHVQYFETWANLLYKLLG